MAEYIKRDALKKRFEKRLNWLEKDIHDEYSGALYDGCEIDAKLIDEIPAADVKPMVHGHWIEKEAPVAHKYFECSNCGAHENKHTAIKGYYCWRCGAKMDGGDNNAVD